MTIKGLKKRTFQIISRAEHGDKVSVLFDVVIISMIVLCVVFIVAESFDSLAHKYAGAFDAFETFSVIFFTIEYLLRLWTANLLYPDSKHPHIRYAFSFMALIDLAAILPFYLPFVGVDLRFLRMFRLFRLSRILRLLKLGRYIDSLQTIRHVVKSSASKLVTTLAACTVVMFLAAILMYTVENPEQPEAFPNALASLWWAVCTLTTVGYGDIYPITAVGKVLASIISIVGIGIVAIPTGIISAGFMAAMNHGKQPAHAKTFCPYCGNKLVE